TKLSRGRVALGRHDEPFHRVVDPLRQRALGELDAGAELLLRHELERRDVAPAQASQRLRALDARALAQPRRARPGEAGGDELLPERLAGREAGAVDRLE